MVESERTKHTCLRLELSGTTDPIFIKGTWHPSRFDISITDGSSSWLCNGTKSTRFRICFLCFRPMTDIFFSSSLGTEATEEEVAERAAQWDQPVSEYLHLAEQYLGFQQPNSIYSFSDAPEGSKRVCSILIMILLKGMVFDCVFGYSCLGRLRRKGLNSSGGGSVNYHMTARRSLSGSWIFLWRLT